MSRARALKLGGATGGGLLALAILACVYEVFLTPPGDLSREEIVRRVSRESPIYYADGKRQVGALFTGAHRKYVPLKDMPPLALKAIVAAEDQNFYHHHGVDVLATGKAFVDGVFHLNFRRAGSTITQQTVKILFDDWEHSFRRKVQEALAAFKMERLYSKDQILEFYLNQFHVTSNGNGIGVAAKYYFDKEVKDLDLVETAFIAGTVKHPTKYNPFTKYDSEDRERAEEAAKVRKDYVLKRMEAEGFITAAAAAAAREKPVPFKRGEFRSGDVALVELVRGQLDRPDLLEAVGMEDAEEFNQAGLKIVTTLDADIQAAAETAVRRNLVRLQLLLKGYEPEPAERFKVQTDLRAGEFAYGRVALGPRDAKDPEVQVSFGGPTGVIGAGSLREVAALLAQASGKPAAAHLKTLLQQLSVGAVVFTRVVDYDAAARTATLELARRPTVNGGLIVLDEGEVRAAVPGFDAQGYDRAMQAQRQPGSVFKAIVFHAALQLGWSILDPLSNVRQVFPLNGRLYLPRGDHESSHEEVSMLWTGIESENIAAVWLTAHLLDKLSYEEFKEVLAFLGLTPEPGENARDFQLRLSRLTDVKLGDDGIDERQLDLAAADMIPDAVFDGEPLTARRLRALWWGRGYEAELDKLLHHGKRDAVASDRDLRTMLVATNYRRLTGIAPRARGDWGNLAAAVRKYGVAVARTQSNLAAMLQRFVLVPGPKDEELAYLADEPAHTAMAGLVTRPLADADIQRVFGGGLTAFFGLGVTVGDVRLDGWLSLDRLEKLKGQVDTRTAAAKAASAEMGLSRLYNHHDFRVAVGLRYLVAFTRAMGVSSRLRPVLSFALGTNVVALAEVAKVYQTLLDGRIYRFHDDGPANQLNFVSRIEDAGGAVVFAAKKRVEQLVPPEPSRALLEILRRVVTHGTGRLLHRDLLLPDETGSGLRVPVFGKTGTTNNFISGSFAGFLPYPRDGATKLDARSSYVIAAYAGFDRNEAMLHGHFKGYGGDVALPAWTELAKSIVKTKDYAGKLDSLDIGALAAGELPLAVDGADTAVRVELVRGLMAHDAEMPGTAVVQVAGAADGDAFVPKRGLRLFKADARDPARKAPPGG